MFFNVFDSPCLSPWLAFIHPVFVCVRALHAGAAHGKGRGREVIAVAKSSDLVVMVLDAGKEEDSRHR